MSADKSSLSAKVLYDDPSQTANTAMDNQDIKKDDFVAGDKASSPEEKAGQESHQTTTSDANTNDNTSTPEFEATTNDSAKATSSNETNSSPPVVHTTTTPETSSNQSPDISTNDSDASKHATEISNYESQNLPPTQIPDPDSVNKQANMIGNHDSQKSFTTMVPTSNQDANSVEQTNPPTDDGDNKEAINKSTQTASNKLDTNKDDHGDPLPTTETSTTQIPDSNTNNQSNANTTDSSPKSSTTIGVPTSNQDANSVEQTNPPTDDGDNKEAINKSTQTASNKLDTNKDDHGDPLPTTETSTTQIPDSNTNNQSNANTTDSSPKSSTTIGVPTSNQDANSVEQTNPPTDDRDNKKAINESTQTASNKLDTNKDDHGDPLPTTETSTSQIPESNTSNQSNANTTHSSSKSSNTAVATSNQDSNIVDQTNQPTPDSDTKQAADQITDTTNNDQQTNKHENLMPADESSTSQIPSTNANKESNAIATDESPKTSTTIVPTSNQDPNSVDPANPPTTDGGTKQDTYDSTSTQIDSNEDRKHLETLIDQELKIIKRIYPKLGEHEKKIKEDTQKASKRYEALKGEKCDIKELKDLKKTVTKLKLQIPARYMSYDENDKQKNQQSDVENRDGIHIKLLKKMPRLHDKYFYESPICNAIHLRFSKLSYELKLCLLCFSVFPEKAIISRRSMIYWWIGEGFIPTTQEYDNEEGANRFFEELMENDFIEPVSRSYGRRVATCKMNPMVRAALVMIADKVNFFDFDEYGDPKDLGKFDEIESPEDMPGVHPLGEPREFFEFFDKNMKPTSEPIEFVDCQFAALPHDRSILPVKRDGKPIDKSKNHYYYRKREITTKSHKVCLVGSGLSKGIPWENLHMLFNVKDIILELKTEWFLRMKNINILFFGRWHNSLVHHIEIDEFEFSKSLDQMNHVRFFCLKGVSSIPKLPDSISKLKSLVILDLRACHDLVEIPESIGSLKCLTHLDMSECYLLKKIPKEVSLLDSLQVLKGFLVVESSEIKGICTLHDLQKLVNLRKLSMYTHMKNFPQQSHLDALQKLETLRKLTILWGAEESNPQTNTPKQDVANESKSQTSTSKKDVDDESMLQMITRKQSQTSTSKKDVDDESMLQMITPKQDADDESNPQMNTSLQDTGDKAKRQMSTSKQDAGDKPNSQTSTSKKDVGDDSKPQKNTLKEDAGKKKYNLASKFMRLVHKKKQVKGSMRRMDAFSTSTLGSRLEKLDLVCFRHNEAKNWVTADRFKGLKKLYIRGGNFSDLGQYDQLLKTDESAPNETWNVEILRLKYLEELNMEWRELQTLFPKLISLEKVKCPRLTLFPCNEQGIWMKKDYQGPPNNKKLSRVDAL